VHKDEREDQLLRKETEDHVHVERIERTSIDK
jgi:hypothetical protein